jgi:amidase
MTAGLQLVLSERTRVEGVRAQRRPTTPFTIVEASIADLRTAMEQGRTTSHAIVQQSLERIATYEERLNATIAVNPRALAEADERDRERRQGRIRGPLHGIPIALKDNIHTSDMPTTAAHSPSPAWFHRTRRR